MLCHLHEQRWTLPSLFGNVSAEHAIWFLFRDSTRDTNYFPRCYDKMRFFPDTERSVWCDKKNILSGPDGIKFAVACCDYADYCNRDLRPSFRFANEGGTINRQSKATAAWDFSLPRLRRSRGSFSFRLNEILVKTSTDQ